MSRSVLIFLQNLLGFGGVAGTLFVLLDWLLFKQPFAVALASGLTFGLVYGATMAVVYRPGSFTLPSGERRAFFNRIEQVLRKMRYDVVVNGRDNMVFRYRPILLKGLTMPREVSVTIADGTATVSGPRVLLKQLRLRLRRG